MGTRKGKGDPPEANEPVGRKEPEGSRTLATGGLPKATTAYSKKRAWGEAFLKTLANTGVVRVACVAAGVHFTTAYEHRSKDPAFAEAWDTALEEACDALEAEARRRALIGTERPVFYKGQQCGTIREYSDVLLIFLLKANRPEKYRDNFDLRKVLASVPESAPVPAAND